MKLYGTAITLLLLMPFASQAQQQDMPGMQMSSPENTRAMTNLMQQMTPHSFIQQIEHHASAGTSAEPNSTPSPMLMEMKRQWMLMFHGNAFVLDQQQTSARGGDKFFSTNWFMPMAEREVGTTGQLTLRAMFSLEPATITDRRYPLLFQQGETAFGTPIVDGQHPHDLFMELAALYDLKLTSRTLLSFYAAPVGDPAIGPTAFPHRQSAAEDPVAALGHHQEDSTHIAYDVVTAGVTHDFSHIGMRLEASGFHGQEPGENRWTIAAAPVDSWSTRLTLQPGQNWSGQYSYARIASPEALFPNENQARTTASIMYNLPLREGKMGRGNWASTAVWGRTRDIPDNSKENSYLFESTLNFLSTNNLYTRIENAGRTNELLVGENPLPSGFIEQPLADVQAYTFGYDRDFHLLPHMATAFGAQVTTYGVPAVLQPAYGSDPVGIAMFLRIRPSSQEHP